MSALGNNVWLAAAATMLHKLAFKQKEPIPSEGYRVHLCRSQFLQPVLRINPLQLQFPGTVARDPAMSRQGAENSIPFRAGLDRSEDINRKSL